MAENADFSGWATKANLKCSDGRTIMPNAFSEQDGERVPLVWQHKHDAPENILGHAILENRADGVYAQCFFNTTSAAQNAKELVKHGDIKNLSIYANGLLEKSKRVIHGKIREVSLVLAGANPGAMIENVSVRHSDGEVDVLEDQARIYTDVEIEHFDDSTDIGDDPTLEDVYNSLTDEQKEALEVIVRHAAESATEEDAQDPNKDQEEPTSQEVYDSLSHEQKEVVEYLIAVAVEGESVEHADSDLSIEDVYNTLTDQQKEVVNYMIGVALEEAESSSDESDASAQHDNNNEDDNQSLNHQEGSEMPKSEITHNVFEKDAKTKKDENTLSHADVTDILSTAVKLGSVKEAVEDYALKHGIEDIDVLFPDAKAVTTTPDFLARRTAWVATVMDGTRHTPFSRIKSLYADITPDEARAKGYIKGNMKREEFFKVAKRVTTPQTVYKKQKLDRDDIVDITDFDVVVWLKAELQLMLQEEIAGAVLIGDGRSSGDDDKISEDNIRPIATDEELYATTAFVNVADAGSNPDEIVDAVILNRINYRGSGNPSFFIKETVLAQILVAKDSLGRRLYPTVQDVAAAFGVSSVIPVELFERDATLVGIMVNLQDYTIGADAGGAQNFFDFFDIDFNQYKYLLETRVSGALTKLKSAVVFRTTAGSNVLATPVAPTFDGAHTVTVPTDAHSVYTRTDTGATLTQGSTIVLNSTTLTEVTISAAPAAGYYFATNDNTWSFSFVD